jgi:Tfp pilus assembly protein PilN
MRPVNLLPAERRKAERQGPKFTPLHGAGLGMLVGALALGYMGHGLHGQIDAETAKIADLDQQTTTLTAQVEKAKSESKVIVSSYETDRALVSGLAVARVNWSTVMINLSRVAPGGVWLKSMSVTTPTTADAAAASTPGARRPAAIKLEASAKTRTEAALFLSRLNGIPGFVDPRLVGGINPDGGDAASGGAAATGFTFSVEIPVDDAIFGPGARPAVPAQTAAPSTTTQTTQP